jgi:hypothetical protein
MAIMRVKGGERIMACLEVVLVAVPGAGNVVAFRDGLRGKETFDALVRHSGSSERFSIFTGALHYENKIYVSWDADGWLIQYEWTDPYGMERRTGHLRPDAPVKEILNYLPCVEGEVRNTG